MAAGMTKDLLQSDLEFAKRLINTHRADGEIVTALSHRGVEPGKAAELVRDLRSGKIAEINTVPARQVAAAKRAETDGIEPEPARWPPASQPRPPSPKSFGVRWLFAGLILCLAASVVVPSWNHAYHAKTSSLLDELERAPQDNSSLRNQIAVRRLNHEEAARLKALGAAERSLSPNQLVLELQPDGLYIGGSLVSRRNALQAVSQVIGAPTRTNHLEQPKQVIYAYDRHGLLVYSGEGAADDSILLDFDAMGGTHGTQLPFAGTLKVDKNLIHADTDAATLAAIKMLRLSNAGGDESTLRGRCSNLDLYFAYLKTPRRLSLIEINLK